MTLQPSPLGHDAQSPAFDALSAMVRDAKRGEVRLPEPPDAPAPQPTGRLPRSWYRPAPSAKAPPQKPSLSRDLIHAGALGLGTGVAVLFGLLWLNSAERKPTAVALDRAEAGLLLVAAQNDSVSLSTALAPADRMRALIELARVRMLVGDIASARTLLARADVALDADALFLMAETYDANALGQWASRNVAPDAERARALYAAANALGHLEAEARLERLPP